MISKDRLLMQQQIYNFLRSVTIKYDPIAQYLNDQIVKKGYPLNEQDPESWKYYLNMQGKYHASDTLMYVTSLDTQQQILFSPDVLTVHPRTKSVYKPGGIYYKRLCETYPEQVDLIKSILFPVTDVEKAIKSDDLTLLQYGTGYLEEYEEKLMIMEIEEFLEILKERWYFDFLDDEPYFYLVFWGSLWTYLAMLLMTARESYVHTPYVHTWHIWNDLKAQGLDDYSDILDRKKAMMLYQNIDYLKANAGKQSNLILLANRLLNDFGVAIYGRKVVQESETGAERYQLTPQLQAVRVPTDTATITTEISSETVATIQSKVYSKGLTPENTSEAAVVKERRLGDTTLNNFMTKFLEIRPITRNKIYSDILNMFLLETLTTSIIRGYYNEPVNINDLSTGVALYLYPRELLSLYHYATQKSLGIEPEFIPTQVSLYKAFKTELGTPKKTLQWGDELVYVSSHFNPNDVLSGLEYNTSIADPAAFTEMLTDQWLRYMDHHLKDQNTKIDKRHFILDYLMSLCHERRVETIDLIPGFATYKDWLGPQGIDIASSVLSQYDVQMDPSSAWANLADSIMSALVPINDVLDNFGNFTLSDFGYTRLRQLFVQMCSYRVVFLESSRSTPQYTTGSKWSTRYGPDHMGTYGERDIVRYIKRNDEYLIKKDHTVHRGFCEESVINAESSGNYSVTTISETEEIKSETYGDRTKFVTRTTGITMTYGSLNMVHAGMIPDGIRSKEQDLSIIDDDGLFILDADGSYLVDPDQILTDDEDNSNVIDSDGTPLIDDDGNRIVDPDD